MHAVVSFCFQVSSEPELLKKTMLDKNAIAKKQATMVCDFLVFKESLSDEVVIILERQKPTFLNNVVQRTTVIYEDQAILS